jgi:hypothetical protein
MPPAPRIPRPDLAGLPLSILVDFDGTISRTDIPDMLLRRHVADRERLAALDAAYDAGTIGSRELAVLDMGLLPDPPDALREEAGAVPCDPGFVTLVAFARRHGMAIEIVSDGLGFYIEPLLAGMGLTDIPVATNENRMRGGGRAMAFPYTHPGCRWCGTCKRGRVLAHRAAGQLVVLVGDGTSDRYAAHHADLVYATRSLRAWCEREGIPHVAWHDLHDVVTSLDAARAAGALPARRDLVDAWRADRLERPGRPAYICGPEVGMEPPPTV